jgi:hypothetical protein
MTTTEPWPGNAEPPRSSAQIGSTPAMSTDTKMFRGWPAEALEFYKGLEAGNSTAYWTARKDVYETVVLSAMKAILAEFAPEFGDGKVFRPSRDVRFSAESGRPLQCRQVRYKTHIGAIIGASYRDGRLTGRSRRRPSRKVSTFSL